MREYWRNLVSTALLGTERQELPQPGQGLASLLHHLPSEREAALLSAAALCRTYLQAGQVLASDPSPLPAPAEPDLQPSYSPKAAAYLGRMVKGEFADLLPEWLEATVQAGLRAPAHQLTELLFLGLDKKELRPHIRKVLGLRGLWLAQQHPQGGWAIGEENLIETFQTGPREARIAAFASLRSQDPAGARALLQESWASETHEDRAAFLATFESGLSLEDEAFLEAALDDKRKEVRSAAADWLASLPQSRLVRRMIERAKPLLTYKPAGLMGLKKAKVEVTLPEQFQKDWARDGLEQKNVPYGMGEKAWWLQQMVSRVPPSIWGEPRDWLAALDKEWRDLLAEAWRLAAVRFAEPGWLEALIGYFSDYRAESLIQALPAKERSAQALRLLESGTGALSPESPEWLFIKNCPKPLEAALQAAFIHRAVQSLGLWQRMEKPSWETRSFLGELGQQLPLAALEALSPALRQAYANPQHPLYEAFDAMLRRLEFRKGMLEAIGGRNARSD